MAESREECSDFSQFTILPFVGMMREPVLQRLIELHKPVPLDLTKSAGHRDPDPGG